MKHLLIGVCDPCDMDRERFTNYLKIAEAALEGSFDVHAFASGAELLENYHIYYQMLIIHPPLDDMEIDELLTEIRKKDAFVHIVLVSEKPDFCHIGYRYRINNYFTKPGWYFKILHELEYYFSNGALLYKPHIWIEDHRVHYKLYVHKIRYIQSVSYQLYFHYENDTVIARGPFALYEEELEQKGFFRCHNRYIVNLAYVKEVSRCNSQYTIHLVTGETIPVGYGKRLQLMEKLQEFANK